MDITLRSVLLYLAGPAGAGAAGYWLMENVPLLRDLASGWKRIVGLAIPGIIAGLAWYLAILATYLPAPTTTLEWIEAAFAIVVSAIAGQVIHGLRKLRWQRLRG